MNNWKQKLLFTIHYMPFTGRAFTLAEVLITLGIIGVVAAMTIPVLMNNIQDQQLKEALKKDVSVLSQATERMAYDNGGTLKGLFTVGTWQNSNSFLPYFSLIKVCNQNIDTGGCWHQNGKWYNYNGAPVTLTTVPNFYTENLAGMLKDGSLILFSVGGSSTCSGAWLHQEGSGYGATDCEIILVDVNGFKPPNKTGKDIFALSLREPGIVYPGVNNPQNIGLDCAGAVMRGQTCP